MRFLYFPKLWFTVSGLLMIISIVFLSLGGLRLGMDFTGGSFLQVSFDTLPETSQVVETLEGLSLSGVTVQQSGDKTMNIRMATIDNETRVGILEKLNADFGKTEEQSFSSIGPTIGEELKQKALVAIVLVLVAIVIYLAWAFRKVTGQRISSWMFGLSAIAALFHDILITTGLFAVLGYFFGIEVDALFITALLTILGFSVHDTIVVFDRVRENLLHAHQRPLEDTVKVSVAQTLVRSLNTSITVILVLLAMLLFSPPALTYFLIALLAGFVVGTYSSIFVASPLLVVMARYRK